MSTDAIGWSISFDRAEIADMLNGGGIPRRVPQTEEQWADLMGRLQSAMDHSTAGEAINDALYGVIDTLEVEPESA